VQYALSRQEPFELNYQIRFMPNPIKTSCLEKLAKKYGKPKQLSGSLSLFDISNGTARVYIRYSKIHGRNQAFYGLRQSDLKQLEGYNSVICFYGIHNLNQFLFHFLNLKRYSIPFHLLQMDNTKLKFISVMAQNFILQMQDALT